MNTIKKTWSKPSYIRLFSIGIIALGIICICFAASHIWKQTVIPLEGSQIQSVPLVEKNSDRQPLVFYNQQPKSGDEIGTLSIPALNQNWPIIEGTSDTELNVGVGHYIQSVLPGANDNCVLSGHRDTVFSEIGKLTLKDQFIVVTAAGTFTYEICEIRIVEKQDKTVIVPTDHAVLTVTTCYPFIFVGNAPKRYILVADLVSDEKQPNISKLNIIQPERIVE